MLVIIAMDGLQLKFPSYIEWDTKTLNLLIDLFTTLDTTLESWEINPLVKSLENLSYVINSIDENWGLSNIQFSIDNTTIYLANLVECWKTNKIVLTANGSSFKLGLSNLIFKYEILELKDVLEFLLGAIAQNYEARDLSISLDKINIDLTPVINKFILSRITLSVNGQTLNSSNIMSELQVGIN